TPEEKQKMFREADFAFRQAMAFCTYNLEALYKYINLLLNVGRVDDCILLVRTSLKFDPENQPLYTLLDQLRGYKQAPLTTGGASSGAKQIHPSPGLHHQVNRTEQRAAQ